MQRTFWITLLASTLMLAACGSQATAAPTALTEVPAAPDGGFIASDGVVASAKVVPAREAQMSFAISAPVEKVHVKGGDVVKSGDTLITLYSPELQLSVTMAELDVEAKELEYVYWIPRLDRPPERRDQAKAEAEQAKAGLETARVMLAQNSLLAPFDGTVVDITVQEGELAQAGQVVITLGDLANMQIETTDLSERDISVVQIGQGANIYIEALDVTLTGRVIRISPFSDTLGGDVVFPVTIELDEQPEGLLWGMSAEVEILSPP
jgi:multidrug efflux pump subunit AcrA (membrane-fusion protein)